MRLQVVMPTVVSLFAGCGGSSLGYQWAGFKELLAIDNNANACETFALNFPDVLCWQRDVRTVTGAEVLEACGIVRGQLDVMDGSPPCQGFSTAGKRRVNDSRNDLSYEFVRLIDELQPRAFVMENVSGMVKGRMRGKFNAILAALKGTGYRVQCRLLNAMYYGVPQSRERLIWVGLRDDVVGEYEWPERQQIITLSQALDGCPEGLCYCQMFGKQVQVAKQLKPGQCGSDILGAGKWFGHRKARWDRPCYTVPKESWQIYHPDTSKPFTVSELLRIHSFPDKFLLAGTWRNQSSRLGNSVPPKFMQAIAGRLKAVLDGN